MEAQELKIQKTSYYYTVGDLNQETKHLFLVFHGYGQLASRIIKKFDVLTPHHTFSIAPEGFSRFYWDEKTGIVGASWMTRKDRLNEIADYCNYIQQLYDTYSQQIDQPVKIHVLGFSQGGATAVRWIERNQPKIDSLILWGSAFPPDLDYSQSLAYFNKIDKYLVLGDKDEFVSPERIERHKKFVEKQGINYQFRSFDGKHEIDRQVLENLFQEIATK